MTTDEIRDLLVAAIVFAPSCESVKVEDIRACVDACVPAIANVVKGMESKR